MASEYVDFLRPRMFSPENLNQVPFLVPSNDALSLPLKKVGAIAYNALSQIPGSLTVATGLTFTVVLTDDGADANDLGKVVRVGVTVKRMINGETTDIDTAAATEATVDVTLAAATGGIVVATLPIANAALDSLATGEAFLVRVRRVASASQDTCNNQVLLLAVGVKNT
jgi:hypothetical protein